MKRVENLLHKDLCYLIVGCIYDVYNQLGFGHREKVYQNALVNEFREHNLHFSKEHTASILYKGNNIGRYYYDFVIEDKVVLELKVGNEILESYRNQLLSYIKSSHIRLGILAVISKEGVKIKRVIN